MSKLVKEIDGNLCIAHRAVYGPGYTVLVVDGQSAEGWTYYEDDVEREDFALAWQQPSDAEVAYGLGDIVSHGGVVWRSLLDANVWEPGVSGWREATDDFASWIQPTGEHDAYPEDAVVSHGGKLWRSLLDANVWEPGVSGWRESVLLPPSGEVQPPAWVQPTGGHDAYQIGDRVTHSGHVWRSTVADNVWEPGVSGWEQE